MKKIYFVRHGETDGNVGGFRQGPEQPLNDQGRKQAVLLAERIAHLKIDKVFVSSMARAQETAEIILAPTAHTPEVSDLFRELKDPTSVCSADAASADHEAIARFRTQKELNVEDETWHFDDEENTAEFLVRVRKVIDFLSAQTEENILVVSHGHMIRYVAGHVVTGGEYSLREAYNFNRRFTTSNTGITVFLVDGQDWKLFTWNDHAHFAE